MGNKVILQNCLRKEIYIHRLSFSQMGEDPAGKLLPIMAIY